MRVVKVMVHVATTCPKCGGEMVSMALADVTPDGRIGAADPETLRGECNACFRAERDAEEKVRELKLEQRKWAARNHFRPDRPRRR